MKIGQKGKNLIFLISQPRAGSTLLQRVLASHSRIYTVSEPWIMLHPLYSFRSKGISTEYNVNLYVKAAREFVKNLPEGEKTYWEILRKSFSLLYNFVLKEQGKNIFLDKTPRYYFIIPQLYHIFPEANFIILLRNPLAVLCSILRTWINGNWFALNYYKNDLIRAPVLLLRGIKVLGKRCIVVHYEDLINNPRKEIKKICHGLNINFEESIINYGNHNIPRWSYGDQDRVYKFGQPIKKNAQSWQKMLDKPQVWRLAYDYMKTLGRETIEEMGYSFEEFYRVLKKFYPNQFSLLTTFSLDWFLKKPKKQKKLWQRVLVFLIKSFREYGIVGVVHSIRRRIIRALSIH
jgi:hypothetical protein